MQRWSNLFIPTLREAPADAEVASHKLLLRAGYVRQLGAGLYSFLPLGQRSLNKIVRIVREEMDRIGQEFHLPALNPAEIWQESGRWTAMGDNMFRLHDRKGAELCLAMTHEEIMTSIARNEIRSYKQLPQIWYQIQTKFRDEPRPKSGLLRVRQFLMKDAYSFDLDEAGLDESYRKHDEVYRRIFTRCGLEFVAVEADSGSMGGSQSQEFMVYTEAGEDLIASSASGYAANLEKATSLPSKTVDLPAGSPLTPDEIPPDAETVTERLEEEWGSREVSSTFYKLSRNPATVNAPELIYTPGKAAIADICDFLKMSPAHDIKCVAFMGEALGQTTLRPVVAFLRGDHQVNETKLNAIAGTIDLRPMTPDELQRHIGGPAGYLGPVGIPEVMTQGSLNGLKSGKALDKLKGVLREDGTGALKTITVLDLGLEHRRNLVAGANKLDFHFRNVTPGRDFTPTTIADIRNINEGELDPIGGQPLRLGKAVEIGHIFKLGRKYTDSMHARVLDKDGKEATPIMGSYGIGIERILTSAIESSAAKFAASATLNNSVPSTAGAPSTLSSRPEPRSGGAERPASSAATNNTDPQYALPTAIAPFEVVVTITNTREVALNTAGLDLAEALDLAGIDVLLDDRDERAGVKFKDADLIGIPFRVNVGKKLAGNVLELVDRLNGTTLDIPAEGAAAHIANLIQASKL